MLSIDFYRPNYDMDVKELVDRLIDLSFAEDIGDGDHTTLCCIPEDAMGKSHLLIKEDGILAGVEVAKEVFHRFDPDMKVEVLMQDGARVKKGDIAMIVTGKTRSLLQTERLMLNIMQRMSGIATMTDKYGSTPAKPLLECACWKSRLLRLVADATTVSVFSI